MPRLWSAGVAFLLFSLGNASDAFLLLRAAALGFDATGLALLWSGFHIVKWLASAPSGWLADRLGPKPQILLGWAVYAISYAGFALSDGIAPLLAWFAVHAAASQTERYEADPESYSPDLRRKIEGGRALSGVHFLRGEEEDGVEEVRITQRGCGEQE